jgi:replicative superfamily II helicase
MLIPVLPCLSPDACSYRQMAGRGGRAGIDTLGECILINQEIPLTAGERLFTSGATPVQSCLVEGKRGELTNFLAKQCLAVHGSS